MAGKLKGITVEIGGDTTKLGNALKGVNSNVKTLQSELRGVNTLLKMDPSNVTLLKQKQDLLNQSISETKEKLNILKGTQAQVQEQFEKGEITEEQYRDFQREIVATEQKLESLKGEAKDFGSVFQQQCENASKKVKDVGGKIEDVGKKMSGLSVGAVAVMGGSLKAFDELDAGYDTIITKTGATGESLEGLTTVADNLFGNIPTEMETVGTAVGEINTRFGFTGEKLEGLSEQFIQFAEINGVDLNNSIGTVDKILEQFNMTGDDAGGVLDLITKKAQETGISADSLMSIVQDNGATFKDMGIGVNEAVGLLSQFEANGVNVETAVKGLKKATVEYTEEGLSMEEALGKTIDKIKNAKSDTEALAIAQEIFGTKGANEMAKGIREGRISVDDLSTSMKDYGGTVSDTFNATLDPIDNAKVGLNNLKLVGAELGGTLYTSLEPIINKIVDGLKNLVTWFSGLSEGTRTTIVVILGIVASLAPLIITIGKVVSAVGSIISIAGKVGTALKAVKTAFSAFNAVLLANPIAIVITAIVALIAIFVTLYKKCDWFREGVDKIMKKVKDFFVNGFNSIKTFLTTKVPEIINNVVTWFKQLPDKIWNSIKSAVSKVSTWGSNLLSTAKSKASAVVSGVVSYMKQLPGKIYDSIKSAISRVTSWGSSLISTAKNKVSSMVSGVVSVAKQIPNKIRSAISGAISVITTWGSNLLSKAKSGVQKVVNGVVTTFKTVVSKVKSIGSEIVTGVWNGISNKVDWIKSKIVGFKDAVLNKLKSVFGIHSPSRLMKSEIGENIAKGVVEGVDSQKGNVKKSAEELSKLYVSSAKSKIEELKTANKITEADEVAFWEKIKSECKKGTDAYSKATVQLNKAKATLNADMKALDDQYAKDVKSVTEQLKKDIQSVTDAYNDAVTARQNEITTSLKLFDAFEADDAVSKGDLTKNLKSQVNALKEWDATLDSLANRKGMDDGLLSELEGMGVKSLSTLKELNSMSDEELKKYISLYKKKNKVALERAETENEDLKKSTTKHIRTLVKSADKSLNSLEKTYEKNLKKLGVTTSDTSKDIGKDIVKGLKKGISSQNKDFQKYLTKFFNSITSNAKNALDIHSPSRIFADLIGTNIPLGIAKGIEDSTAHLKAMDKMNDDILDTASNINGVTLRRQMETTFTGTMSPDKTLLAEIRSVSAKLEKMKIVLDTGVLVGETVAEYDRALSNIKTQKARGW